MHVPAQLGYFEQWVAPVALDILGAQRNIALHRLRYADSPSRTWQTLSQLHGYQISPRGELQEPWFADAHLIARCPNLLAVTSTGAGYDMIDVDACTAAGIIVCNQTGSNHISVAEHALGLTLGLVKGIASADRAIRRKPNLNRFDWMGDDLCGKTVGIVGLGQIGTRMAQLCAAFGVDVIAYDPLLSEEEIARRGARKVDFTDILKHADVISVHCPRTRETLGMFGAREFAAMKPTAYFVNTARGGIHDEEALACALQAGRIAGAGVDVFLEEPPSLDHALLHVEHVIATPHVAGLSVQAVKTMARFAAEQWIAIFKGSAPPRLINPQAWPKYCARFKSTFGFAPDDL